MDEWFKRSSEEAPVAVMARLELQQAISAEWVNQAFEDHSKTQETRELLFSTVVEVMSRWSRLGCGRILAASGAEASAVAFAVSMRLERTAATFVPRFEREP